MTSITALYWLLVFLFCLGLVVGGVGLQTIKYLLEEILDEIKTKTKTKDK